MVRRALGKVRSKSKPETQPPKTQREQTAKAGLFPLFLFRFLCRL